MSLPFEYDRVAVGEFGGATPLATDTIDVDGLDPVIMPATGTPEPGGLGWREALALLRTVIERRNVVGCDLVELSPTGGNVAPNFLCAKLVYKILSYRFGRDAAGVSR